MRIDLQDDDAVEVQMAPLIDCVFLLLIFFLVATSLKKIEKELPLELPHSAAAISVSVDPQTMVIGIDRTGQPYINGQPVTFGVLEQQISTAAANDPQQRVRIDADRDTPWQHVVHILDALQFRGLNNVGVHTKRFDRR
ncbi:MAG: biopolymer transporter ExbD [Phycisphaeraceae bacterium]